MPNLNYIVSNPKIDFVKIGLWSGEYIDLYQRYLAVYGTHTTIHVFPNDHHRLNEQKCKDMFHTQFAMSTHTELYRKTAFLDIFQYLQRITQTNPQVITDDIIQHFVPLSQKIQNYRTQHNITSEQIQMNTIKKQQKDADAKYFCIVTSPLVELVLFRTTKNEGKHVADYYATYFGPDTEVYYVDTTSTDTNPNQFKERMSIAFQDYNNVWGVFMKDIYLWMYLKYISETQTYTIFHDKKHTTFVPNPSYDTSKQNSPRYKKVQKNLHTPPTIVHNDEHPLYVPIDIYEEHLDELLDTIYSSGNEIQLISQKEKDMQFQHAQQLNETYQLNTFSKACPQLRRQYPNDTQFLSITDKIYTSLANVQHTSVPTC